MVKINAKSTKLLPTFDRGHPAFLYYFSQCCVVKNTGKINQLDLDLVPILPQSSYVTFYKPPICPDSRFSPLSKEFAAQSHNKPSHCAPGMALLKHRTCTMTLELCDVRSCTGTSPVLIVQYHDFKI